MLNSLITETQYWLFLNKEQHSLIIDFFNDREFIILFGILTFSLSIISKNFLGLITQILLFLSNGFEFFLYNGFFPLVVLNAKVFLLHLTTLAILFIVQIFILFLVIKDLIQKIEEESPENL